MSNTPEEPRFLNEYHCEHCDIDWDDIWDCQCNDCCPGCDNETVPFNSIELNEGE